jgi:peptide/nickel transport system permease protein
MWAYLVRRVAWAAVVFVAVTLVTFVVFYVIPTNGPQSVQGRQTRTRDVARTEQQLGLERPLAVRYAGFLRDLARGSLGRSYTQRRSVDDIVLRAAPVTASVILGGILIWLAVGLVVGILSALRPRSLLDRVSMVGVLVGVSAHPIWLGFLLAWLLGAKAHVFPVTGYCDFFDPALHARCGGPAEWAYHLVLPCVTLAVFFAAMYVRMIRASVLDVLEADYVRTARAKGASETRVIVRHVLRNALLPLVTMLGMDVGLSLGGAAFVEVVFGLPGLGHVAFEHLGFVRSVDTASYSPVDLPVTAGIVVVLTTVIIVTNLLADLLYSWVDPRVAVAGAAVPV